MTSPLIELRDLKCIDGKIVQVGKATQETDHDSPMWLCQTQPPLKQVFNPVSYRLEVIAWLKEECGADEIIEGAVVED
jgi:hypothetical protein